MPPTVALTLALALTLPAAGKPASASPRADAVAPFLDEQTVGVAHVATSGIDADALVANAAALAGIDVKELGPAPRLFREWLDAFSKAGGKELYFVFSLADGLEHPPFAVVPLGKGADAAAIAALLRGPGSGAAYEAAEKLNRAVVGGRAATLERLRSLKPVRRPEVADAFAAAGDTTAQVLCLPTADSRRVVEEMIPTLPKEVGGGPVTVLTRGVMWAALGLDLQRKTSLRLVIQSRDEGAAQALREFLLANLKAVAGRKEVHALWPDFEKLAGKLEPRAEKDRLVLTLDEATLTALLRPVVVPGVVAARESAIRNRSINNLKQIGLALHNYHSEHKTFPALANYDKTGKPLLSWRVHILPYLDEDKLYREFHLDEPWDSDHNKKLIERMPAVFRSAGARGKAGKTTYQGVVGEATMFPGRKAVALKEVTDGTSNTIFVVDADEDHAIPWTSPEDMKLDPKAPVAGLVGHGRRGFEALVVDGSVRFIMANIDPQTLLALFTRNGGEPVEP